LNFRCTVIGDFGATSHKECLSYAQDTR